MAFYKIHLAVLFSTRHFIINSQVSHIAKGYRLLFCGITVGLQGLTVNGINQSLVIKNLLEKKT